MRMIQEVSMYLEHVGTKPILTTSLTRTYDIRNLLVVINVFRNLAYGLQRTALYKY